MKTLEDFKPAYRSTHVTAEYRGRRYLIAHAVDHMGAETIATDFSDAYRGACLFTGDVYGSQSMDGGPTAFKAAYAKGQGLN
jgi:hypothetical protein